jgi:hypothetical protein
MGFQLGNLGNDVLLIGQYLGLLIMDPLHDFEVDQSIHTMFIY